MAVCRWVHIFFPFNFFSFAEKKTQKSEKRKAKHDINCLMILCKYFPTDSLEICYNIIIRTQINLNRKYNYDRFYSNVKWPLFRKGEYFLFAFFPSDGKALTVFAGFYLFFHYLAVGIYSRISII